MEKTTLQVLNEFLEYERSAEEKAKEFISLTNRQLNWRQGENRWSVAECFEHLIRTNEKFVTVFQKYSSAADSPDVKPFRHTLIGKLIIKSVTPDVKRKHKTRPPFNPLGSSIGENIVNNYLEQHNKIIEAVKNLDHSKFAEKVTSPFSGFVKYNVGDSLVIIANHDLRHLNQAERVIQSAGFPL
jgi:uncharacterized damage-inducible protein DinB